jgi:hypothetical protein
MMSSIILSYKKKNVVQDKFIKNILITQTLTLSAIDFIFYLGSNQSYDERYSQVFMYYYKINNNTTGIANAITIAQSTLISSQH